MPRRPGKCRRSTRPTTGSKSGEVFRPTYQNQRSGQQGGYDPFGGYNPFGGGWYYETRQTRPEGDDYQRSASQCGIRYGRYQEAINALNNSTNRDARWYYLSALATQGVGNQVTALEHIRRAVSMEPDNREYLSALEQDRAWRSGLSPVCRKFPRLYHGRQSLRQPVHVLSGPAAVLPGAVLLLLISKI